LLGRGGGRGGRGVGGCTTDIMIIWLG